MRLPDGAEVMAFEEVQPGELFLSRMTNDAPVFVAIRAAADERLENGHLYATVLNRLAEERGNQLFWKFRWSHPVLNLRREWFVDIPTLDPPPTFGEIAAGEPLLILSGATYYLATPGSGVFLNLATGDIVREPPIKNSLYATWERFNIRLRQRETQEGSVEIFRWPSD